MSGRHRSLHPALVPPLAALAVLLPSGRASGQCDPDVVWEVHPPTGDVAEVLVSGETAWIGAQGGVIRVQLAGVASGDPEQVKITEREGLVSTNVTAMARDSFGNLWVGTRERGISIFRPSGTHLANLSSFRELWSDRVIGIAGRGDRMIVSSADGFTPQGSPEGGGFVILGLTPDGGGLTFTPVAWTPIDVAREVLVEADAIWFGTSGSGLWVRDERVTPADFRQQLTQATGLASNNVKKIVRGPSFPSGDALWLGTGAGLQRYTPGSGTPDSLQTIGGDLAGRNILDLFLDGTTLWVLAEQGVSRDLWPLDLTTGSLGRRTPRADCTGDTTYVPRQVAVDAAGRIVLGTRAAGYFVRLGLNWLCPPPLGPHHPQVADLAWHPDGTLYFGTGDKDRLFPGNGVGMFDGADWKSVTRDAGIVHPNMTEVLVWDDGTVWMATSEDRNNGGLNRYFPQFGTLETYHPAVQVVARRTLGRHVRALETDRAGNLWVCYGQNPGGGLSMIEAPPSLRVTNYDFGTLFFTTTLLRDMAFDSLGRIWVVTHTTSIQPAHLYILDPRGTPADPSDDRTVAYNMPNEIFDLGECKDIEIDSADRVWIAGAKGLAYGEIVPNVWPARATWQRITPTAAQAGGRNPLPYEVAALDWDDNIWLGTESAGLVRISKDLSTWTWFDQLQGCPLPDQSVRGIHVDRTRRRVWVGTATGGIARLDLSAARSPGTGEGLDPRPSPNPWNPAADGVLRFTGIPSGQTVDLRVFTLGGELVHEQTGARDPTWNGTNVGGNRIKPGVYVVTGRSRSGATYEGKVAVIR